MPLSSLLSGMTWNRPLYALQFDADCLPGHQRAKSPRCLLLVLFGPPAMSAFPPLLAAKRTCQASVTGANVVRFRGAGGAMSTLRPRSPAEDSTDTLFVRFRSEVHGPFPIASGRRAIRVPLAFVLQASLESSPGIACYRIDSRTNDIG